MLARYGERGVFHVIGVKEEFPIVTVPCGKSIVVFRGIVQGIP